MAYSLETKEAARDLFTARVSMTEIARREGMPSKVTLYKWAEEGEATSGTPWEEYRDQKEAKQIQQSREKALRVQNESTQSFLETAKEDVKRLYKVVRDKVEFGEVEVKPKDVAEMLRLFALLDNQDAEARLKQEKFVRKVFMILVDEVTEQQFAAIKNKIALMMQEERAANDPIARTKSLLPSQ